ncbi:hypothetical protein niasHT_022656 [Heterodera trifolii]|uniref:Uncharacterized protein n=1 Tax=Heterodera trifolii TaxID=157864 RepID=A0ABD2JRE4_9BILA
MEKLPKMARHNGNPTASASAIYHQSRFLCSSDDDSGCAMDEIYAWVPPRTKLDLIHQFFAALPTEKVPRIGTAGEHWRKGQLERQLPRQDADARFCGNLSAQEETELAAFARVRFANSLGRGEVRRSSPAAVGTSKVYCHQCRNCIFSDQIAVWAPSHFGPSAFWHPNCFVCVECGELLVDLIYFAHAQNVFCGRHHAELIKPRCSHCDELIFSEECTEAEGRVWHMRHFCCGRCGVPLGGQRYVMNCEETEAARPLCVRCCRESAKSKCAKCAEQITADRPHIAQGAFHWHADGRCFCCFFCRRALLGKPFSLLSNGRLFCALRGCVSALPQNRPPRSLPPPPFPPPPPPRPTQSRVRFDFQSVFASTQENIYETVAAAKEEGNERAKKGQRKKCQTEANPKKKHRQKNFGIETSESSEAEENEGKPLRRCRSVDGRGERRRKNAKGKMTNKSGQIDNKSGASLAVDNFYSKAPPPENAKILPNYTDEGTLTAALALASTRQRHLRKRRESTAKCGKNYIGRGTVNERNGGREGKGWDGEGSTARLQ